MVIKSSGNIGIGTANPQSKLAVNGKITAKEVQVTVNGWSDFVLKKDYELKSLEEVEKFIDMNGHLPDIPSEKEVMDNGISLGEMNAKLLQKIEELTLYMIANKKEMNSEIDKLKKENKILKEKLLKLEIKF